MTLPLSPGEFTAPLEQWVSDLEWHRQVYRHSKFQWSDTDAVLVATEFTYGRQQFDTIADLRRLEQRRLKLAAYTTTCQRAFGGAIGDVRHAFGDDTDWCRTSELIGVDPIECAESAFFANWADPRDYRLHTNPQVRRIRSMCAGFVFASPLLLAWELKQLWRLYQAAENILEDTVVDLVDELDTVREDDLARAAGMATVDGLRDRVETQRRTRGRSGDARRVPVQTF